MPSHMIYHKRQHKAWLCDLMLYNTHALNIVLLRDNICPVLDVCAASCTWAGKGDPQTLGNTGVILHICNMSICS